MKNIREKKALLLSILAISIPAIGEMGLNTLLGLSDTLMISHFIGYEALVAIGYVNQIVSTMIVIFSAFNTGATVLISRAYGEKNYDNLNRIAGQNITINVIIGVIIITLGTIFSKQIFGIYDMSRSVMALTLEYYYIIVLGMIFMFISFACASILRGAGDTVTPMTITGISNILNIIGNYILIKGVGPFPELEIAGAAWATIISRFIGVALYIYTLFIKDGRIHIRFKDMKFHKKTLRYLYQLSYPGAIEQTLRQITYISINIFISQLDTNCEAAFRIISNIEAISFMPALGLSIAAATLVGKALGEKDIEKAVETGYTVAALGILWGLFMGSIFFIFPDEILKIFTTEADIIRISILTMYVVGIDQPFLNFMTIISGALRGAGDTRGVMVINALNLAMLIPVSYIFIIPLQKGVAGMWYAEIITFIIFSSVMIMRFRGKKWVKLNIGR